MGALIVGVDPGTTVGYAALDEQGRLMALSSAKFMSISDIINELIAFGEPVVIGTDKRNAPSLVRALSAKLGMRIISGQADMTVAEKKRLARGVGAENDHERDALASAKYAFNFVRETVSRVTAAAGRAGVSGRSAMLIRLVVVKEFSISEALRRLEGNGKREVTLKPEEQPSKKMPDPDKLLIRLARKEREAIILRNYIISLQEKIRKIRIGARRMKRRAEGQRTDDRLLKIARDREENLKGMSRELGLQKTIAQKLSLENEEILSALFRGGNTLALPRVPDLGAVSVAKTIGIIKGSENKMIFVDNPFVHSAKAVGLLSGKATAVLHLGKAPDELGKMADFQIIEASGLIVREHRSFILIDRDKLLKRQRDVIGEVVESYRRRRASEISE